jgi:hypothetical protein
MSGESVESVTIQRSRIPVSRCETWALSGDVLDDTNERAHRSASSAGSTPARRPVSQPPRSAVIRGCSFKRCQTVSIKIILQGKYSSYLRHIPLHEIL